MSNNTAYIFWSEDDGRAKVRCRDGQYRVYSQMKGYGSTYIKDCMSLHSLAACRRMARNKMHCGWIETSCFTYDRGDAQYIKRGKLPPS